MSKSKLVVVMLLALLMLSVVFFTFGNSPRVTPSKDRVASATTTVVSPTKGNVVPEKSSASFNESISLPISTPANTNPLSAKLGFSLLAPAFAISTTQTTVSSAEWTVPTSNSGPFGVALDSSGNVYFTESANAANKVGRLVPSTNTFTEWAVPTSNSGPYGVAVDSSGNVYFTEDNGNKIGRLS